MYQVTSPDICEAPNLLGVPILNLSDFSPLCVFKCFTHHQTSAKPRFSPKSPHFEFVGLFSAVRFQVYQVTSPNIRAGQNLRGFPILNLSEPSPVQTNSNHFPNKVEQIEASLSEFKQTEVNIEVFHHHSRGIGVNSKQIARTYNIQK